MRYDAANAKAEVMWCIRMPGTRFNADYRPSYHAESLRKMAGRECWRGLASTAGKSVKPGGGYALPNNVHQA